MTTEHLVISFQGQSQVFSKNLISKKPKTFVRVLIHILAKNLQPVCAKSHSEKIALKGRTVKAQGIIALGCPHIS